MMSEQRITGSAGRAKKTAPPQDPRVAYYRLMRTIRNRFLLGEVVVAGESDLARSERIALHVRKIVEGVSFAALSACEMRNPAASLARFRDSEANKILRTLFRRQILQLPVPQRFVEPVPGFGAVLEGERGSARGFVVGHDELQAMFSRASEMIHERHPERLTASQVATELSLLIEDILRLRRWLWIHTMKVGASDEILVQMGNYDTDSFMVDLSKVGELPDGFEALLAERRKA